MLRALIIDDESPARERMRALLAGHPQIEVIGSAGSLAEARVLLDSGRPDVVFLDVTMPGGSGFDLLPHLPDSAELVFVTASESHAVDAFAVAALDYLVKPVDPERLSESIARLQRQAPAGVDRLRPAHDATPIRAAAPAPSGAADTVCVPLAGKASSAMVTIGDICWMESLRNYTRVALKGPPWVMLFPEP